MQAATGEDVSAEELGGAELHCTTSGTSSTRKSSYYLFNDAPHTSQITLSSSTQDQALISFHSRAHLPLTHAFTHSSAHALTHLHTDSSIQSTVSLCRSPPGQPDLSTAYSVDAQFSTLPQVLGAVNMGSSTAVTAAVIQSPVQCT